ncbi:hypothetical protein NKH77_54995 [Streptomyces sp. M19]
MLILPADRGPVDDGGAGSARTTRILIGNDFSEDVRTDRGWTGWWVQRIVWFAEPGDILVLPVRPEEAFVDYVTSLTGTDARTLTVVVPPAHAGSEGTLSRPGSPTPSSPRHWTRPWETARSPRSPPCGPTPPSPAWPGPWASRPRCPDTDSSTRQAG